MEGNWSALIGVVIGGGVGFVSALGVKWFSDQRQRRALIAAFRAEILSVLDGIRTRKHIEAVKFMITAHNAGTTPPERYFHAKGIPLDPVFTANVGEIGLLGAQFAEQITAFYSLLNMMRADMQLLNDPIYTGWPANQKAAFLQHELERWLAGYAKAEELCVTLGRAALPWYQRLTTRFTK